MEIHAEIPPFKAYVHETFLYDMDPEKTDLIKCEVFGVSSYPGHMITFTILISSTGATFCYIPLHALHSSKTVVDGRLLLESNDLQVANCLEKDISVICYDHLKNKKVLGFFKNKQLKLEGEYLFSVDWYKKNDLWHVIKLTTGQFCALPNYRVLFGNNSSHLPDYKVMNSEWIL